jgi:hypothetical protein
LLLVLTFCFLATFGIFFGIAYIRVLSYADTLKFTFARGLDCKNRLDYKAVETRGPVFGLFARYPISTMPAWRELLRLRRSPRRNGQLESSAPHISVVAHNDHSQSAPIIDSSAVDMASLPSDRVPTTIQEEDMLEYYAPEDIFAPDGDSDIAPINAANLTPRRQSPLLRRVPFEIWMEIFIFATIIPGKDDLTVDPIAYTAMTCDKASSNILTPAEQFQVYCGRLEIIRVCRYWYAIGVRLLWSHLRVTLPDSTGRFRHIYHILERRPEISKSIIRLTIRYRPNSRYGGAVSVERMIKHLTNLRILYCPTEFGTIGHFYRPDIVVLNPQFGVHQVLPMLGGRFWLNVRILIFRQGLGRIMTYAPEEVEFSQLETLHIHDEHGNVLKYIAEYWRMPVLRTLSIETTSPSSGWIKILESCAMNLQKLELLAKPPIRDQLDGITMDRLKVLYLASGDSGWRNTVYAPSLERLGLYTLFGTDKRIKAEIDRLLAAFPKVAELCISSRFDSGGLSQTDLAGWRRRGIDIELIYPTRLFVVL